jgi:hypothetical protein
MVSEWVDSMPLRYWTRRSCFLHLWSAPLPLERSITTAQGLSAPAGTRLLALSLYHSVMLSRVGPMTVYSYLGSEKEPFRCRKTYPPRLHKHFDLARELSDFHAHNCPPTTATRGVNYAIILILIIYYQNIDGLMSHTQSDFSRE